MMKGIQKFSIGVGVLFLFMLLRIAGDSGQKVYCGQIGIEVLMLQSAGKASLEYNGKAEAVGDVSPKRNRREIEGVKNARSFAKESTEIKLTWRTGRKTDQIRIFRANNKHKPYKWKKIAVLKGGRSSYVDSVYYDTDYKYEIAAYQKKGKKYKRLGSDFCYGFSGLPKMEWDEYAHCDTLTTPESIFINTYACTDIPIDYEAFKPDGFEIFRSMDGKNFKCIKIVNKKMWQLKYTDRTVQGHQAYYYKVRAFRKIRKKKYCGAFSCVMRYAAVNSTAGYFVKMLTEEGDALSSLVLCLDSEKGNGDFVFDKSAGFFDNENDSVSMVVERYSYDGKKWSVPGDGNIVLRPGEKTYLQLARYDGGTLSYRKGDRAEIRYIYGDYNNLYYRLSIDLDKLTASAVVDGEFYH